MRYIFPDKVEKTLYATIYISWQNNENIICDIYIYPDKIEKTLYANFLWLGILWLGILCIRNLVC